MNITLDESRYVEIKLLCLCCLQLWLKVCHMTTVVLNSKCNGL